MTPTGCALALSGGGFRAMLFHLGGIVRLDEAGILPKLDRISSVSGGSITAASLAKHWPALQQPGHVLDTVGQDLFALAGRTVDVPAVLKGTLGRGTIGDHVAKAYRRAFLGELTLQDLPDAPRFVFNATSLQTGALWRFEKPYMADYRVGMVKEPKLPLAVAVAASSAFPPVLSPVTLDLTKHRVEDMPGTDLHAPPYTQKAVLSDGGVYDNLGLQAVEGCATIFCSDGGGRLAPDPRPKRLWPLQLLRVLDVIDNQVRALRKRHLVAAYEAEHPPEGAFWGIRTDIADYGLGDDVLPCPPEQTRELADVPTRLAKLDQQTQRRLVNWGYAVADAAVRRHSGVDGPRGTFPFPKEAV